MNTGEHWKFWIDVGGTFTDCWAKRPDGGQIHTKVLSSGVTKGRFQPTSDSRVVLADSRNEPDDFWTGAELRLLNPGGQSFFRSEIPGFRSVGSTSFKPQYLPADAGLFPELGPFQLAGSVPWSEIEAILRAEGFLAYELDAKIPAPLLAIHGILGISLNQPLPDLTIDLGTTKGTNALLTRTGARTALITSYGFKDFLAIGDQAREQLFALTVTAREPLYAQAIEIDERILQDGTVERVPDPATLRLQLQQLRQLGIESLAICLMFGYRYPQHEQQVASLARSLGFETVRCSSEVAPLIKIVPRGETTVLDAYLDPVISDYLNQIQKRLSPESRLRLMTSSGGLVTRERFSGKDSVLSGPAGGVVGSARVGQQAGFERVIGFDMGGTSTDVSRFEGEFNRTFETRKAGVRIVHPMLDVETVAAGGGSVCWFDGTRLRVGPHSAGANPGPACYGSGGPLTVTDINLFLGRLSRDWFPFPLYPLAVEQGLDGLRISLLEAGYNLSLRQIAEGLLQIANHSMANAIESVSVARGFDPREYLLVSFGGAASQHCCGVADQLGMTKILCHPQASILSAVGIQLADQAAHAVIGLNWILELNPSNHSSLEQRMQVEAIPQLIEGALQSLRADGVATHPTTQPTQPTQPIQLRFSLDLRYQGTESFLNVRAGELQTQLGSLGSYRNQSRSAQRDQQIKLMPLFSGLRSALVEFDRQHRQQFGYLQQRPIEIVAARLEACFPGPGLPPLEKKNVCRAGNNDSVVPRRELPDTATEDSGMFDSEAPSFQQFDRTALVAGEMIAGPAIIADRYSTTVVDAGWTAKLLEKGLLLLEKFASVPNSPLTPDGMETRKQVDPILLEIFNQHFSSIASQMGTVLQKTSVSVNVKERLDFSCAVFSGDGRLVVNAPHIPVHLGAMGQTVRKLIEMNPNPVPGDVYVTNDPYAGGSHLPDVTVATPVFPDNPPSDSRRISPWFWVACRSHHSEIGGISPGSMPANASCLAEEGVLIQNFKLLAGQPGETGGPPQSSGDAAAKNPSGSASEQFEALKQLLNGAPFPSRSPEENIADIRAQVAANQTGVQRLRELVDRYGFPTVSAYMDHIQEAAEQKTRRALLRLADGESGWLDELDNGAKIQVRLDKRADQLTIDFEGTSPVLSDNLNANPAIVEAAVMYVMRLLIAEEIPLNEGILKPIRLKIPDCFLNPVTAIAAAAGDSSRLPAIVGGNVETSQRIVDCLLGSLGLAAASQGTMNNWLIGDGTFGYYETVGGGTGATSQGPGINATHSHMTNTRLTDPEILESRYPVILREFGIRRGSGGQGRHPGGEGMVRELEFRQPLTLSLLTSRRNSPPYGLSGGKAGAVGQNWLFTSGDQVPGGNSSKESAPAASIQSGMNSDTGQVEKPLQADPPSGYRTLPSRCQVQVQAGDRLRLETPGGGGWGLVD
jgi:5-oxoprolinase (ATP-hydrolysing)